MDRKLLTVFLLCAVGALAENDRTCVTPNGEKAKCVDLDSCIILQDFIKNPIREAKEYLIKSRCDDGGKIKMCCPSSLNATVFNTKVSQNDTKIELLERTNCGYRNEEVMSIYQLPWLGTITAFGWPLCSCSLINARYVITSATCASENFLGSAEETGVVIRFGDFNQEITDKNCSDETGRTNADCLLFEDFGTEYYTAHPFHDKMTHYASHDIGLVRLNRTVVYKDYIRPICLPPFKSAGVQPGDILYTAGWGINHDRETGKERIKNKIPTSLLTKEQCAAEFKICDSIDLQIKIPPSSMCLKEDINNTVLVLGETGGPVINPYDNQWHLEGVLSSRRDACREPQLYTRVESYMGWIKDNMRPWT